MFITTHCRNCSHICIIPNFCFVWIGRDSRESDGFAAQAVRRALLRKWERVLRRRCCVRSGDVSRLHNHVRTRTVGEKTGAGTRVPASIILGFLIVVEVIHLSKCEKKVFPSPFFYAVKYFTTKEIFVSFIAESSNHVGRGSAGFAQDEGRLRGSRRPGG